MFYSNCHLQRIALFSGQNKKKNNFLMLSSLVYNQQFKGSAYNFGTSQMCLHKIRLRSLTVRGLINETMLYLISQDDQGTDIAWISWALKPIQEFSRMMCRANIQCR